MKALIVGGYGVFGGRLARLLMRDGVEVIIAGRSFERAAAFALAYGGEPLGLNIRGDLSPIINAGPDIVVDAAGPFQCYGRDPYRLARYCLANGIHYLDLSDDGDFTAGIAGLNEEAKRAGRIALSGCSSVPAISAAAVRRLSEGLDEILSIETAILPGNRAPRGRSVMAAILAQAGAPLKVWRGGAWQMEAGWSDRRNYRLSSDDIRSADLIGAPDLVLFPEAFGARSVTFRAGLELPIMHHGLAFLAALRRRGLLSDLRFLTAPLHVLARWLERFGTDRGGMVVEVTGLRAGEALRSRWRLIAKAGDGPFIPTVPAWAIIRRLNTIAAGARPCLEDLTLDDVAAATSDLAVSFDFDQGPATVLFQQALGPMWSKLPDSIRRLHSVYDLERFSGWAEIKRGRSPLARLAARLFGFPQEGADVPVTVTKRRAGDAEIWERNFAGRIFRSRISASPRASHIVERFGPFAFEIELSAGDRALSWPVRRGWFFGLPLPRWLLPRSQTREYESDGRFHFEVGLYAPITGNLVVHYQGQLGPALLSRVA